MRFGEKFVEKVDVYAKVSGYHFRGVTKLIVS